MPHRYGLLHAQGSCQLQHMWGGSCIHGQVWLSCVAVSHGCMSDQLHVGCAGSVDVAPDVAEELLQAADQYMLEPLKRLCEAAIAADLSH